MHAFHRHRGGLAGVAAAAAAVITIAIIALAFWGDISPAVVPPPAAHAQSDAGLPPPANQQAWNTGAIGEVRVSWDPVAGVSAYRIGWLNHNDYLAAGDTWLQRFTFADVPPSVFQYSITRLTPGEEYWFIVASVDANNRMSWPQRWIPKFRTTAPAPTPTPTPMPTPTPTPTPAPDPTPCPTPHGGSGSGDGAMCPITGLPLGEGYLYVGDRADSPGFSYRLDSVTTPATVRILAGGSAFYPFSGRQWVRTCGTVWNHYDFTTALYNGSGIVIDSDTGIGFHVPKYDERPNRIGPGRSGRQCYTWNLPATASTVILAVNLYFDHETVRLFRIDLP